MANEDQLVQAWRRRERPTNANGNNQANLRASNELLGETKIVFQICSTSGDELSCLGRIKSGMFAMIEPGWS